MVLFYVICYCILLHAAYSRRHVGYGGGRDPSKKYVIGLCCIWFYFMLFVVVVGKDGGDGDGSDGGGGDGSDGGGGDSGANVHILGKKGSREGVTSAISSL